MAVLVMALWCILGIAIGFSIGKYKAKCEFGKMLYLLERSGQLKFKEVTSDEKDSR
jgi:hypothetical protein